MELASDDLVPLMIMTLIQSSLTDLVSTVDYISEFDFTQLKERELGYLSLHLLIPASAFPPSRWRRSFSSRRRANTSFLCSSSPSRHTPFCSPPPPRASNSSRHLSHYHRAGVSTPHDAAAFSSTPTAWSIAAMRAAPRILFARKTRHPLP